ncbi:hypothetical protein CHL74_02005 [Prevotella sp. 885]|nr:hypothetical protein CHL74_02005 [Prevotella sp. 885]
MVLWMLLFLLGHPSFLSANLAVEGEGAALALYPLHDDALPLGGDDVTPAYLRWLYHVCLILKFGRLP